MQELELDFDEIIESINNKDQEVLKDLKQTLLYKFGGDRTGIFERAVKKYKEVQILEKGTKEVLKSYQNLYKSRVKKVESQKNFIDFLMKLFDEKKLDLLNGKLSYRKNPGSLEIFGEVSEDYKEIIETVEIKNAKIKEDLENGIELDFARIIKGESLQIK